MKNAIRLARGNAAFVSSSIVSIARIAGVIAQQAANRFRVPDQDHSEVHRARRFARALGVVALLAFAPRVNAQLADGLISQYTFNGNANNSVSSLYDGTVYGATLTADRFGNANSAYAFSGFEQYIELSGSGGFDLQTGFTLTAWARFDTAVSTGERMIIAKHLGGYDNGFFLGSIYAQNYPMFFVNSDPRLIGSGSANDGQWHSIVGVFDGATQKLYFDGSLIESSAAAALTLTNGTPVTIGRCYPASGYLPTEAARYFGGAIDDVRIYDRALSGTEVAGLYALENTSAVPEPVDYAAAMAFAAACVALIRRKARQGTSSVVATPT